MSIAHILYQLLIRPLELIFEVAYGVAIGLTDNHGLSIFVLSLTVNVLLLPLYRRADAIQDEERQIGQRLAPWVKHIKKTFSGDERYMMLQTYYRQNNYKPYYALRGMMPLVLEIPFFIAAYRFLSNLEALQGTPFGPIRDLGAPDGLLTLGGLTVHLLPVAMTLINAISSAIYTKGLPAKDKLQLYGMALVFLVLLYGSPSGLVLYWILNNLFSLFKNLFYMLKDPRKVLCVSLAVLGAGLGVFVLGYYRRAGGRHALFLLLLALLAELPLALHALRGRLPDRLPVLTEKPEGRLFFAGAAFLAVLTGALIPTAVIRSSPAEFVLSYAYRDPLWHVLDALLMAAGFFLVWLGLFYLLADKRGKGLLALLLWLLCGAALVDYMGFGENRVILLSSLQYERTLEFTKREKLLDLLAILAVAALFFLLWRKKRSLVGGVYAVFILAALGMSAVNAVKIESALPAVRQAFETAQSSEQATIPLSRKGKNIVVLMLDRAISRYIPYLFQERPELAEQFAGFTYYPNTISFGNTTSVGSPALFGGYEYTPEAMNARPDEQLVDKHNEALRVMPVLFDEAGYAVTVCDPSYANYQWIPDISIYDDYPRIRAFLTEYGQFSYDREQFVVEPFRRIWTRNFFCYSVMKLSPLALQNYLYRDGSYFMPTLGIRSEAKLSYSTTNDVNEQFISSYGALRALPEISRVSDETGDTFLMLVNSATHSPQILQEPDYIPALVADNREFDAAHWDRFTVDGVAMRVESPFQMAHYQVNMAALLQLGTWFDYLRENGVWDNTRIVITADHGIGLNQFDDLMLPTGGLDVQTVNPLLMVKDFGSTEFMTDRSFMTNADTPALATNGLFPQAVNPFTGRPLQAADKDGREQHILLASGENLYPRTDNTFQPDAWFAVRDDIFDPDNWSYLGVK